MRKTMLLPFAAAFVAVQVSFAVSVPYNGQTEPGEYEISTYAQLTNFTQTARSFAFSNSTITLTADIDCGNNVLAGDRARLYDPSTFCGTFDGAGHRIHNFNTGVQKTRLEQNYTYNYTYGLAMFDIVRDGAVIKNLTLEGRVFDDLSWDENYYFHFNSPCAAAFATYAQGANAVTFENCNFDGTVNFHGGAAAFVGRATRNDGDAPDSTVVTLTGCGTAPYTYITATTNTSSSVKAIAGGLVAEGEGVVATDCFFDGVVRGWSTAGGIVGRVLDSTLTRCSFNGWTEYWVDAGVVPSRGDGCGGIVGYSSNSVFRACSVDAHVVWKTGVALQDGWWRGLTTLNFVAAGGMAGLTAGESAFYDCVSTSSVRCVRGLGGGFAGWTAGAETFSNCTAVVTIDEIEGNPYVSGGFAASVASSGAKFINCTVEVAGGDIKSGFFDVQDECRTAGPVGTNWFTRCTVTNSAPSTAGFAGSVTNAVFDSCLVVDSSPKGAGFAGTVMSGTFTNCTVTGVSSDFAGFVRRATNSVFACCLVTNSTLGSAGFAGSAVRSSFAGCEVTRSSAGTVGFAGESTRSTFTDCKVGGSSTVGAGFTGSSTYTTFADCLVTNVMAGTAGFAQETTDGVFTNCAVRGGVASDGFVANANARNEFRSCAVVGAKATNGFVGNAFNGNLFEDCVVLESKVKEGFADSAGSSTVSVEQNVFRGCRVCCVFMDESKGECHGFARALHNGATVTNCIAYGVARYEMEAIYGFAGTVGNGATVSCCVSSVAPSKFTAKGAGFVDAIQAGARVVDCYSVFGPRVDARSYGEDTEDGVQGGFARSVGTADPAVERCFTLYSIPAESVGVGGCGGFCGVIKNNTQRFNDCYRPSESAASDSYNMNYEGIGRMTAADFRSATVATFPNYDFENVWRAPAGVASSPYLPAATDADGNFWTYTAVASGYGRITVNGGEPLEAYPPGTVLTVRAEPIGESQFTGWIGEGFADPTAQETTYTVGNVGAILATFDMAPYDGQTEPGTYLISTVEQLRLLNATARGYSYDGSTILLDADIDCGGGSFISGNLGNPASFFGTFDGAGYRIFNFRNTVAGNSVYGIALFDTLAPGALLRNLTLEGTSCVSSRSLGNAAVFVSHAYSDYLNGCATIDNCHFTGTVSNLLGAAVFVGTTFRSPYTREGVPSLILTNCTADATVITATNAPAGGLVSNVDGIFVADCAFAGRVESVGTAGGIAGYAQNSTFTNCAFSGEMAGGTTNIAYRLSKVGCGGLVGFASNAVFRACAAQADIDWDYSADANDRNQSANNFIAVGGAAGLTMGDATFDGCSFNGTVQSVHGYAGGFVGWTAGAELFTNCTASAAVNPTGSVNNVALGGFAASVGSRGAQFIDCSVNGSSGVLSGFYDVHDKCFAAGNVGTNYFTRCTVAGTSASDAGFAGSPAKAVFTECEVQGGAAFSGFVKMSGEDCTYTDCVVTGATVRVGFVHDMRGTNILTNCRAGCLYGAHAGELAVSDARYWGFATYLRNYSVLDRCVAYGAVVADRFDVSTGDTYALFARSIDYDATVRRSVGAVTQTFSPRDDTRFAMSLSGNATVENSYSVFQDDAGTALAKDPNGNFWTLAAVVAGEGAILVDGAAPAAAYAPDSVHAIRAVPAQGYVFSHWVGRGYGNVDSAETTYTAGNCGAIAAVFAKEVNTPAEFLAIAENPAASYKVTKDMSLAGFLGEGGASSGILGEFRGRLYGGGHTVSGVRFTDADGGIYMVRARAALFKNVAPGAQVRDLTVEASAGNEFAVVAGLALAIEDHTLVSNCHVRADFHALPGVSWTRKCEYYGIASNVVGSSVRVIDCDVSGTIEGREHAAGLFGKVSLHSGEIARCASFCDIHANGPGGVASGFANSLTVGYGYGGGATVREIVTAGSIFGTATGAGIAAKITFAYNDATVRDLYSTAEVRAYTGYGIASGIAQTISAAQSDNVAISNVWFGGTALGGWRRNYAFADIVENVALENCAYVEWPASGGKSYVGCGAGPAVAAIPSASRLQRASWPGFDFGGVWTMTENSTTPYFAWSLGGRLSSAAAVAEDGDPPGFHIFTHQARGTTITCADTAAPGASVAVAAGIEPGSDAFFVRWDGAPGYTDRENTSTVFVADNHRTVNGVWGRNISTPAQLQAVTNDLSGIYHVVADLDMTDFDLSTIGGVYYESLTSIHYDDYNGFYPFFGIFEGNGHTISNMVSTDSNYLPNSCGGLFCRLREAKVGNIRFVSPRVVSFDISGALAGEIVLSSVSNCAAIGVCVNGDTYNSSDYFAGGLAGRVDGSVITRSFAAGYVSGIQVGGFVGSVTNSVITECFSSGFAKSSKGKGGGFAEEVEAETDIHDCYTVCDVEGAAGFAGYVAGDDTAIVRCYCAGITRGTTSLGGFILGISDSPTITDCFRRHYDIYEKNNVRDVGSSDHPGIAALLADEMRSVTNFTAYLATRTSGSSSLPVWEQVDGETHPYFPWSLEDGKLSIVRMNVGRNDWSLEYAALSGVDLVYPGASSNLPCDGVNILEYWNIFGELVRQGRTFFEWNGVPDDVGKRYRAETVTKADNYRTAVARYGLLLENLGMLTNNPSGTFGLYGGSTAVPEDWEPMGKSSKVPGFHGTIYGGGGSFFSSNGKPVFYRLGGAVFKGVKFAGELYGTTVGAAANIASGNVVFEDCEATPYVSPERGASTVGGFFGTIESGTITFEQCTTGGEINGVNYAGGFVGTASGGQAIFIDCTSSTRIFGSSNLGGMFGSIGYTGGTFSFLRCVANGMLEGTSNDVGGLIGSSNNRIVCEDSRTTMNVTGGYTPSVGGFIGKLNSNAARSSFLNCHVSGSVVNPDINLSGAGGFAGDVIAQYTTFTDCSALGDVTTGGPEGVGGFVARVQGANTVFTNCVAAGAVTGRGKGGGFVGTVTGNGSLFTSCEASGHVARASDGGFSNGGFVGSSGSSSSTTITYEYCRALGGVSVASKSYNGGFVGYVQGADRYYRCMAAGPVKGDAQVGGFGGYFKCSGIRVSECFALGDVFGQGGKTGGFVGSVDNVATFSDSYAIGSVNSIESQVGGFAGNVANTSGMSFTRCYSAGDVKGYNSQVGAFAGNFGGSVSVTNCAALCGDPASAPRAGITPVHAIGGSYTNTAERTGIAELEGDDFKNSTNFEAFFEARTSGSSSLPIWAQVDGKTQPYLAWSAPDGNLSVYPVVYGAANGMIGVDRERAPAGTKVRIAANPNIGSFFVGWTGSAPYDDASDSTTMMTLDNHRAATTQFGRYVFDAYELQAITNELDGVFGLYSDIDLSELEYEKVIDDPSYVFPIRETIKLSWLPIGRGYNKMAFTGKFFGFGRHISNLVCTNNVDKGTGDLGLFGVTTFAVIDGVTVSGRAKGTVDVGGFVGEANVTLITNCTARVEVSPAGTSLNGPFGGFVGSSLGSTLVGCRSDGFVAGGGHVGGFVGVANRCTVISDSAARGDVRSVSSSNGRGGFAGRIESNTYGTSAFVSNCWCSGAVWGLGSYFGSFAGDGGTTATVVDCAVADSRTGKRKASGGDNKNNAERRLLTAAEVAERSAGWPAPLERDFSAAKHITTAEELAAVRDDLSGIYILDKDINLKGANWTPIGDTSTGFSGEFYGNGHRISNFTVTGSDTCEGFFGKIEGGRVKGLRLKGRATSNSTASYSNVGGFAGRIDYGSLVEDCSFRGDVEGYSNSVGGFAGRIDWAAVVAGCCVTGSVWKTSSSSLGCGGFAGYLNPNGGGGGLRIMDCYSLASVDGGMSSGSGGFVGSFGSDNATIYTSYCSGSVTNTASYLGAFVGSFASKACITNSYYDCDATTMLAQGGYRTGESAANPGITPLTHEAMLHAESFTNFDFVATWKIDEGETTPYLIAVGVFLSAYEQWLADNGLPTDTDPSAVTNGVPYLIRYAFDVPTAPFSPFTGISFKANGDVVIETMEVKNDEGVTVKWFSSTSLTEGWEEVESTEVTIEPDGKLVFRRTDDPARFYKFTVEE